MSISSSEFYNIVLDRLLGLLWRQWSAIGVSGYSDAAETTVVDPEALLLLTLTVARHDPRLYDEVLGWLGGNGDILNVQRLQNIAKRSDPRAQAALGAVAEMLSGRSSSALKWKTLSATCVPAEATPLFYMADGRSMPTPDECDEIFHRHGFLRPRILKRRHTPAFPKEGAATLLLRLRALLGVSVRCEVLCLLGAHDEIHPALAAQLLGLAPRSVQNLLAEMARSGVVQVRTSARKKSYALVSGSLDDLLRPDGRTPWVNSVPLFQALERLWSGLSDPRRPDLEPLLLASQWRRLAAEIRPLLGDAGLGQPLRDGAGYPGAEYYEVFIEDTIRILDGIPQQ